MSTETHHQSSITVTLPRFWSDLLAEFTANQIPIHLIDLDTLQLVSRFDVARHYRTALAALVQKRPLLRNASQLEAMRVIFKLVRYAIFSHRWLAEGEPTFGDMPLVSTFAGVLIQDDETALAHALAQNVPDVATRNGLHKLLQFCSKARTYGCRFAWSDTCCIHKDSSAELDESIRAMFRWYHNAYICIVHLASSLVLDDIPADEWFTRGWTLQELLAPENMKFYNRDWRAFTEAKNDKDRRNGWAPEGEVNPVWRAMRLATQIPSTRLGYFSPGAFDVAQRLSWAAGRRTTRIEDAAYALVGIFGINMPVQYGEGRFAFQRLMEALLLRVQGYGILMWTGPPSTYSAALPASIKGYLAARGADDSVSVPNEYGDPALMLTHKGLQLEVLLVTMECREPCEDGREGETSSNSSQDSNESSDWRTALEERQEDPVAQSSEDEHVASVDEPLDSDALSTSDSETDSLGIRFLDNDEEYQPIPDGLSWFHFTDPEGIFRPVSVHGRGPIVFDDFVTDLQPRQYAFAIIDYHRDWACGPGCVYVPYFQKSKYLAFVLYRDDPGEVWQKMQTDMLVYVEVKTQMTYGAKTVSICL